VHVLFARVSWHSAGARAFNSQTRTRRSQSRKEARSNFLACFFFGVSFEGTPSRFPAQAANRGTSVVPLVWTCLGSTRLIMHVLEACIWAGCGRHQRWAPSNRRCLDETPINTALNPAPLGLRVHHPLRDRHDLISLVSGGCTRPLVCPMQFDSRLRAQGT
jgi:hypothetical protein